MKPTNDSDGAKEEDSVAKEFANHPLVQGTRYDSRLKDHALPTSPTPYVSKGPDPFQLALLAATLEVGSRGLKEGKPVDAAANHETTAMGQRIIEEVDDNNHQ
jgi:hypothetical protein